MPKIMLSDELKIISALKFINTFISL